MITSTNSSPAGYWIDTCHSSHSLPTLVTGLQFWTCDCQVGSGNNSLCFESGGTSMFFHVQFGPYICICILLIIVILWLDLQVIANPCDAHDDVIPWKHIPHCWHFVMGTAGDPWISLTMGQYCGPMNIFLVVSLNTVLNKLSSIYIVLFDKFTDIISSMQSIWRDWQ